MSSMATPRYSADWSISKFEQLGERACDGASKMSHAVHWGTDRCYPDELDGD